ncbi:MAG: hypothetical protein EHM72_12770 [Calditrichaeota bacterium]|nr:MAG: hypothetical protein EHM72_12770 [Calditrichota bacterium]
MKRLMHFLVIVSALLSACSSNKLREYDLRESNLAARSFIPPRADVQTGADVYFNTKDPIGTILSVGSTVAREVEAMKARARLDSAMMLVDIPAIVEEDVLFKAAELLNSRPVNEIDAADFLLDIDFKKHGIDAQSWAGGVDFVIDAKVNLVDQKQGRRIWKRHIEEREPLSPALFGLGPSIGNVIDAVALSKLTVEEMATGLENLAHFTADRIAHKLYDDFIKSRD